MTLRGPKAPRRGADLNQLSIIPDGSILVRDGIVQEVGPTRRVENLGLARQAIEVSAVGRVVMPGFVDSHTHMLFPAPGTPSPGIESGARALHGVTALRLKALARPYLESMARHGTTTAEVKTGSGADESAEMKVLRVVAELKREPISLLPSILFCKRAGECEDALQWARRWVCDEFLPKIRRRHLACFADLAWGDESDLHGFAAQYFQSARRLGLACTVHADSANPSEAVGVGVAHGAVSIDHLEHVTEGDAALLGRAESVATLLPAASFHAQGWFAPGRALIDAGAAVALATNFNSHHSPTLSMQTVVALACRRMNLTPAEAISAATINGAHALGYGAHIGSLELGKSADLVVLNVSDHRDLAHHFGANLVHMTMKRGEVIYEEGVVAPRPVEDLRPAW